jgi:phosphoribosylformylglycinamidine synthase II
VKKGREAEVEQIFEKWDLHAAHIGEVTADGRMRVKDHGVVVADIPNAALTDGAPVYRRPMQEPDYLSKARQLSLDALPAPERASVVFARLLSSPAIASKRCVYRQYDHMVRTNTLVLPGMGAAVVRVKGTTKALAMSTDCNSRFVYLDPFLGAQLAVAEASRNVACAGAQPIGATNCLNFGNPERPEIMWQFGRAVEGLGAACRSLGIPVTGGNVSLYNETDGRAVLPTPVLGIVGLIDDASTVVRRTFSADGDVIVLLGVSRPELGGSEYLKVMHQTIQGVPPVLGLDAEAALQRVLIAGARSRLLHSAHDCAEGGIAVTLAECCFDTGRGAIVDINQLGADDGRFDVVATLFGESASRVVVSVAPDRVAELLSLAGGEGVPATRLGEVGGQTIRIAIDGVPAIDVPVSDAERIWSAAVESYLDADKADVR